MSVSLSKIRCMRVSVILTSFIVAVALSLPVNRAVAAPSPQEVVRTGTDQVLQILKERSRDRDGRRMAIRKVVNEYFDFDDMAKRSLGPPWKQQPPEKQQEFVQAFSQFLFNVYIRKIEKYTNEKLSYRAKQADGNSAVVEALVVGGQAGEVRINYRLHLTDGAWKVYDVEIEGIDLVQNYRSQFNAMLAQGSFESLLKQLREKNVENG